MMLEQDPPRARPESETTASDPLSGLAAGLGEAVPGAVPPQDPTPADAMPADSMPAGQPIGTAEPADPAAAEPPAEVPAETPATPSMPSTPPIPPTPDAQALANARGGRWAMNEYFDGLVLLGVDGRPVMRADRTRVGFFFADAPRLAERLAREQDAPADPRRALAPLDAGFDGDWDPQIQTSYFATMTKMTRLMAYDYVRTTEPEEAVRKAVATIFGNPRHIDKPGMKVWVPAKYDVEAVKSVATGLLRQVIGTDDNLLMNTPARVTSFEELDATMKRENGTVSDAQTAQTVHPGSSGARFRVSSPPPPKPPVPREPERDPPRPSMARQERQWQRTSPTVQPDDVKETLARSRLKDSWRQALRNVETQGRPDNGYGTYLFAQDGFAYGAYQFRRINLQQIGLRTADRRWTGKFGARGWQDFLNSAEAQEAALVESTRFSEESVERNHKGRLGKEIITPKERITVTKSGLIAAMHVWGSTGVFRYMQWVEKNNWASSSTKPPGREESYNEIERRLRIFQTIDY